MGELEKGWEWRQCLEMRSQMATTATMLSSLWAPHGCRTQVQSGFHAVRDHIFKSCGLFSDSILIYLGRVSVFFLRSCYFAWDWHKWSLNYVEIAGAIAFIALVYIDECPAGYWLYTLSKGNYMPLRNVIQYKYDTKSNILSITSLTNLHPIVAMVRRKALAYLGFHSCLVWSWPWSRLQHWFTFSYNSLNFRSHSAQ